MNRDKLQIHFIIATLVVVLGIALWILWAIFGINYRLMQYAKDPNKKPAVDKVREFTAKVKTDKNADYYTEIGNAYLILKEYDKAESAYKSSIKITPGLGNFLNLGNLYVEEKNYPKAEAAYFALLTKYPTAPDGYIRLHELYLIPWPGQKYSPSSILELGLRAKGPDLDLYFTLADYYKSVNDLKNAKLYYQKALDMKPENAVIKKELEALKNI